jgi:hypothetical protein
MEGAGRIAWWVEAATTHSMGKTETTLSWDKRAATGLVASLGMISSMEALGMTVSRGKTEMIRFWAGQGRIPCQGALARTYSGVAQTGIGYTVIEETTGWRLPQAISPKSKEHDIVGLTSDH